MSVDETEASDAFAATEPVTQSRDGAAERVSPGLKRGAVVGRYVILHRIGAGAMGEVFAAHDRELDRRVAVKVMLTTAGNSPAATRGRTRLLREAQALAKLAHPNVVTVHDVGEHEGAVYIAMEHVDGTTLRSWIEGERQPWRRVLEVVIGVGDGVAAAHAANLLHRDIKPDNVILGRDGRVRLMDFGLARVAAEAESSETDHIEVAPRGRLGLLEMQITDAGAAPGTPAYMAPEQWRVGLVGPAADQFALCVMTWELLYGVRPFIGSRLHELGQRVLAGQLEEPPPSARVPTWLRRVLERGLAVEPEARFPSVQALIVALGHGQARHRWRRRIHATLGVAAVATGIVAYQQLQSRRAISRCEASGDEIATDWNDERGAALENAVLATEVAYASDSVERTLGHLDAYANEWRRMRVSACMAIDVNDTMDSERADRALWCLDEGRATLSSLATEITAAPAAALPSMVASAARLPRLDSCLDLAWLATSSLPPVEQRASVQAVRADTIRAASLEATANYVNALGLAESALTRARELGWSPLTSAAMSRVGSVHEKQGAYAQAEVAYEDAYFEAAAANAAPEAAFDAATTLAFVVGYRLSRAADGQRWVRVAEALFAGMPNDRSRQARLSRVVGILHRSAGEYELALEKLDFVLEAELEMLGPHHPDVATAIGGLASVRSATGDYEEAAELFERVLAVQETALGGSHPDVGQTLYNIAKVRYQSARYAEAAALAERARGVFVGALGGDHPFVALALGVIGGAQQASGDLAAAKVTMTEALAVTESRNGPAHISTAAALANLALVLDARGEHGEAVKLNRRALAIEESSLGPDHQELASTLFNLGLNYLGAEELREADVHFGRSLAILEKANGADDVSLVEPLVGLAESALGRNEPDAALRSAERAVALATTAAESGAGRPESLAHARFVLARALWLGSPDDALERVRARTLAEQVLESLRSRGEGGRLVADVEKWLATRR